MVLVVSLVDALSRNGGGFVAMHPPQPLGHRIDKYPFLCVVSCFLQRSMCSVSGYQVGPQAFSWVVDQFCSRIPFVFTGEFVYPVNWFSYGVLYF